MKAKVRLGSRRGNAMIEFALSAAVLIPAFTGVFQFGYSLYMYNELVGAVRTGIRYASVAKISKNPADTTLPSAYVTAVQNMVVYGSTTAGQQSAVPNLSANQVSVTGTYDVSGVPTSVTVGVSSYTVDTVFKTFTFTGKPTFTMPFMGEYCSGGPGC
jgi:Flp pilus assembly protein TadG